MGDAMVAVVGASLIIAITVIIPVFTCGYLCGAAITMKKLHMKLKLKTLAEDPVYDEVGPPKTKEKLHTLQNVAYGDIVY